MKVRVKDDDGGEAIGYVDVTVAAATINVPPLVGDEGSSLGLLATVDGLDPAATYEALVLWGDGDSATASATFVNGQLRIAASHVYADNHLGATLYATGVEVRRNGTLVAAGGGTATIANVAPALSGQGNQAALAGVTTSFTLGAFADPGFDFGGRLESFTATVDWGDGAAAGTGHADLDLKRLEPRNARQPQPRLRLGRDEDRHRDRDRRRRRHAQRDLRRGRGADAGAGADRRERRAAAHAVGRDRRLRRRGRHRSQHRLGRRHFEHRHADAVGQHAAAGRRPHLRRQRLVHGLRDDHARRPRDPVRQHHGNHRQRQPRQRSAAERGGGRRRGAELRLRHVRRCGLHLRRRGDHGILHRDGRLGRRQQRTAGAELDLQRFERRERSATSAMRTPPTA